MGLNDKQVKQLEDNKNIELASVYDMLKNTRYTKNYIVECIDFNNNRYTVKSSIQAIKKCFARHKKIVSYKKLSI